MAGTIPSNLLLHLATAFEEGGLRDRNGTFFYKHHLRKSNVPVLAIAGDRDTICPPEAVYGRIIIAIISVSSRLQPLNSQLTLSLFLFLDVDNKAETVKVIPGTLVTYKVFGEPDGPHYGHYDIVGGPSVCALFCLLFFFFLGEYFCILTVMGLFGSCFFKLFLRTVFESIENIILMLSENCYCFLNLMFYVFSVFFITKKKKWEPNIFSLVSL